MIKKLIIFLIKFIIFMVLFFIKIIKPVLSIKFGFTELTRIGGVYYLDWYLSEKKIRNISSFEIFFIMILKNLQINSGRKCGARMCA